MIDYSAFDEKKLVKYAGKLPGLPKLTSPTTVMVYAGIVAFLFIGPFVYSTGGRLVSMMILMSAVLYGSYAFTMKGQEQSIRTALFASRNKFGYSWKGGRYKQLTGLGSIMGEPMKSNVITGHFMGQPFTISGVYGERILKNVMRVELPNKYPHIVLDSKQGDIIPNSLKTVFPSNKEIVLEGNFPDYFRVYTATTPVETLQILSPELMERMIKYSHRADIEIIENQLFLIGNYRLQGKEDYQMMFTAVEQILKDIGVNTNNSKVKFDSVSRI